MSTTPNNSTEARFAAWFARVDAAVTAVSGLSVSDLADQPFWDWFADGVSPKCAARQLLEDEGFPF